MVPSITPGIPAGAALAATSTPSLPPPCRKSVKVPVGPSSSVVPSASSVSHSFVDLTNPPLSHKCSALAPPSSAAPSSSKLLRPAQSLSGIRRTSSAISSSPSLPSPLVFSSSLPSAGHGASSSPMMVDPPEDQVMVLLDALEFAIDKGNLVDARARIRALRKLHRQEKGYSGV